MPKSLAKVRPPSKSRSSASSTTRSKSASPSRRKSRSRSGGKSRKGRRGRSGGRRKRRSRSASRRRSRGKRGASRGSVRPIQTKDSELDNALSPSTLVLEEGQSSLISRHINELEVTLFRPMPEDDRPPLFFDTTACLFSDHGKQIDYVGVGRSMSNGKGLTHKPHAVVSLNSSVEPSTNLLSPAGGTPVVAGDSILVNLKKVSMWSGFTLCATLFTPGACLCDTTDVYYTVKKPNAKVPLAILAVKVDNSEHNSCIVMMIRKVKVNAEVTWELVRIGETLAQQDVKGVVKALQNRGLEDPKKYFLDPSHRLEVMDEYSTDGNNSVDDYYDDDDEVETRLDVSVSSRDCNFDELLANVPRVAREGRRQYNIGRSMLNPFLEGDSSDDDEVMEDALRAVVPSYTDASPVRYDDKTYNVGSSSVKLTRHYVDHREEYGLSNAGSSVKETPLPSLLLASLGELQRLSLGRSPFIRPTVPRELSSILPMVHRRKTCASWKLERSLRSARSSSRGRSRKKKKGRRGGSKKRSSRSPSSKRRRSKKKKGKRTPSPQLEAPDTDLGLVTPRLLSLPSE